MQNSDEQMILWALRADIAVHLVLTKSDKLSRGPANTLQTVQRRYHNNPLSPANYAHPPKNRHRRTNND